MFQIMWYLVTLK